MEQQLLIRAIACSPCAATAVPRLRPLCVACSRSCTSSAIGALPVPRSTQRPSLGESVVSKSRIAAFVRALKNARQRARATSAVEGLPLVAIKLSPRNAAAIFTRNHITGDMRIMILAVDGQGAGTECFAQVLTCTMSWCRERCITEAMSRNCKRMTASCKFLARPQKCCCFFHP
uniref:Uncharacterized protein n=1 Tax=Leersia perrieri TaxID=77586 RepID=A0A0D9XX64_9ORYZ